jgi:transposase
MVADVLGVSRSSVFEWQKKYRESGLAALSTRFASGRPTVLSDEQMVKLYSLIAGKDPRQLSFGMALWTRKMVAELIHRQFGAWLSLVTVGRILRKLGMSPQRPLYRAYQQDPRKVKKWKEKDYPAIRAEAGRAGAAIFLADESGIRTDHHAGTTWAPVGQTPIVTATGERKSVVMVSAVSPRGELHFELFYGTMNAARFIEFCKKLLHDCPSPIFLIVDGSPAHTAKATREYVLSTKGRLRLLRIIENSIRRNRGRWLPGRNQETFSVAAGNR